MKVHDSGMPEEDYWNSLFDIPGIIGWLPLSDQTRLVVEIGCGYGTFTVPVAKAIQGQLHTFDIEQEMLDITSSNLRRLGIPNVTLSRRDVIESGTGLADESADLVLLFNILHFEEKRLLLAEASRVLKPGGCVAILHWRNDMETPRGPVKSSRPDHDQIMQAIPGLNLELHGSPGIMKPFHWGELLLKNITYEPHQP